MGAIICSSSGNQIINKNNVVSKMPLVIVSKDLQWAVSILSWSYLELLHQKPLNDFSYIFNVYYSSSMFATQYLIRHI